MDRSAASISPRPAPRNGWPCIWCAIRWTCPASPASDLRRWRCSTEELADVLKAQRQQIKRALTDQSAIAGIGNAYSDEILHAARLSPFKIATKLTDDEIARLHEAIGTVLTDAVARSVGQKAATLKSEKRSGLKVHARTGLPCEVCGDTIREISLADKSYQYCPTCQTAGRELADRRMSKLLK